MCSSCFERYEITDSPAIRAAAEAIQAVYAFSVVGGHLHIVLDDVNVGDEHLDFCENEISSRGDDDPHGRDPEQMAAERACLALLRPMTEDERASAIRASGAWGQA